MFVHERKTLKNLIHDIPYHWLWYKLVSATQPTIYTTYNRCHQKKKKKWNIAAFSSFYSFYFFFFLQCQMHFQCSHVMLRCYIRIYESWLLNNNCILPNNTQDCKQQYQLENNRIYCEPERELTHFYIMSTPSVIYMDWAFHCTVTQCLIAVYMVAQICQCQFDSWCTSEYKNHGH